MAEQAASRSRTRPHGASDPGRGRREARHGPRPRRPPAGGPHPRAAGNGQHDQVAELIAPLDAEQLRSRDGAGRPGRPERTPSSATGPAAVCELAINAAAPMFGTTPEAIRSAERRRPVSDARAVAMTAARVVGLSLPVIAEHFDKDHGSVIHAVRHTAERPRLADAAARVTAHVNDRYTAQLPPAPRPRWSPCTRRRRGSSLTARSSMRLWRPLRPSGPHRRSCWVPTAAGRPPTAVRLR
ncbi:helix-turn-helix domain-containing protein [Nocardioides daphniae]|uniref:Chromosomal replication initiator DnaA C-terminal domain-containing protein n=1 Tax=Nocardioides daphniae TaxID=402297 RepID=A0A4P7UE41_9ACTN|nr:helix-turn-helix domain-containing protein [Nocardioides daphniae]QCC78553.1 hypothetical protein E2C04_00760 [Nocardioides daphniae]